ncbi:MAG: ankyrin repeat domain-containing protein, partial [Planctomycetota bacterium]
MKFDFLGRLKGVARYLTHAAFEGIFLTEKPWRLVSRECALLVAARQPEVAFAITEELLRRGADPNAAAPGWNCSGEHGTPALLLAAQSNNKEVVRSLLSAGSNPNAREPGTEKSALHCAVANDYFYSFAEDDRPGEDDTFGSTRIIAYSTALPPPPRNSDKRRRPPFAKFERASIVDLLLKAGADVNAMDKFGNTPLMTALASRGYLDWDAQPVIRTVRILLDAGADVRVKNYAGHTALTIAVDLDELGLVKVEPTAASDAEPDYREVIASLRHAELSVNPDSPPISVSEAPTSPAPDALDGSNQRLPQSAPLATPAIAENALVADSAVGQWLSQLPPLEPSETTQLSYHLQRGQNTRAAHPIFGVVVHEQDHDGNLLPFSLSSIPSEDSLSEVDTSILLRLSAIAHEFPGAPVLPLRGQLGALLLAEIL